MMAIKASRARSRADCVRERLGDCEPGAVQRRQPRRERRLDENVDPARAVGGGRVLSLTPGPLRCSPIGRLILRLAQARVPTAGEVEWFLELTRGSARSATSGASAARSGNPENRAARWPTPPGPPTGRSDRDSRSG